MKHQTQKRKRGFSLVELMISLIAISLISAAFVPIITKKLSQGGITIGSFGSTQTPTNPDECTACGDGYFSRKNARNECVCQPCQKTLNHCTKCASDTKCEACESGYQINTENNECISTSCAKTYGAPSAECCKEFKAKYISKEILGTGEDLCVMQYNVGDDGNKFMVNGEETSYNPEYVKYGITVNAAGGNASPDKTAACWKPTQTISTSNGTSTKFNYSANNRTVCNYSAAQIACAIWAPNGSTKGAWRLLTEAEGKAIATQLNGKEKTNSSEDTKNENISRYLNETGLQLCDNDSDNYGMNKCPYKDVCMGADTNRCRPARVFLDAGKTLYNTNTSGTFGVDDSSKTQAQSVRCATTNVYKALAENSQYNQGEQESTDGYEPQSQEDCDNYHSLYINKKFLGENAKNICMFKYNAGDEEQWPSDEKGYEPHIDYVRLGISINQAGNDYRSPDITKACWKGTTSNGNTTNIYSYKANGRMVCNFDAAKEICSAWAIGETNAGDWRLLNSTEANALATMINKDSYYSSYFTRYLNGTGLQLCDEDSNGYGMNNCGYKGACNGATNDRCTPARVYIDTGNTLRSSGTNGKFAVGTTDTSYGGSVRCVSDTVEVE